MIAHVAEASEERGRVVVRTTSARASDIALQAAVRIAQAFQSEIESLYVEDTELIALTRFPFVREIGNRGTAARAITQDEVMQDLRCQFVGLHRRLANLATEAQVALHERTVRDEPLRALSVTCADCGPWNLVVLAEPFHASSGEEIRLLFDNVQDTTGLVLVGPRACRTTGPVVLALEDIEALPGMLRAGNRLIEGTGTPLIVAIVAAEAETASWIDTQARLSLAGEGEAAILIVTKNFATPASVAEALRQLQPGFLIARFGGLVVPAEEDLSPLAAALECPLLLSR